MEKSNLLRSIRVKEFKKFYNSSCFRAISPNLNLFFQVKINHKPVKKDNLI